MAAESLKEYLIKLGWDVDELGLSKATEQVGKFEGKVSKMGSSIVKNFTGATVAVASFLTASITSMVKMLDITAKADLSVERFARKMWTTEESARSFMSALNAMNADYSDIFYMTPEEYKRFMDLRGLGNAIKAPEGLQEGLKLVRDIQGEFSKLKLIVEYATQWVSYYLTKYLKNDMNDVKKGLSDFNSWVSENLPKITEKIAKFFIMTYKLAKSVVIMVKGLAESFAKFFDMLSPKSKAAGAALLGFVGLLAMGPIGAFIAGLLALLLVVDDVQTWMRGGKSAWGDTWEKFASMFSDMDTTGVEKLDGRLDKLLSSLHDVGTALGDLGLGVVDFLDDIGALEFLFDVTITAIDLIASGLQLILDLILLITGNFNKMSDDSLLRKIIRPNDPDDFSKGGSIGFDGLFENKENNEDSKNSKDSKDTKDSKDNVSIFSNENKENDVRNISRSKNNKDGTDGKDGLDGKVGKVGKTGKAGTNGAHGTDGKAGKTGATGATGANGKTGVSGKNGVNGVNGKNGKNGISSTITTTNTTRTTTTNNNTTKNNTTNTTSDTTKNNTTNNNTTKNNNTTNNNTTSNNTTSTTTNDNTVTQGTPIINNNTYEQAKNVSDAPYHDNVVNPVVPQQPYVNPVFEGKEALPTPVEIKGLEDTNKNTGIGTENFMNMLTKLSAIIDGSAGRESIIAKYKAIDSGFSSVSGIKEDSASKRESKGTRKNMTQNQTNNINVYGTSQEAASATAKKIIEMRNHFTPFS